MTDWLKCQINTEGGRWVLVAVQSVDYELEPQNLNSDWIIPLNLWLQPHLSLMYSNREQIIEQDTNVDSVWKETRRPLHRHSSSVNKYNKISESQHKF